MKSGIRVWEPATRVMHFNPSVTEFARWENDDSVEFQRWTGIYDKDGTQIFEGDIVNHTMIGEGVVIYDVGRCAFVLKNEITTPMGRDTSNFYKVVRNVFQPGDFYFLKAYEKSKKA